MIEALRNDDIIEKVGGRFKLASLIQRRWLELVQGGRPMVDPKGLTEIEVVIEVLLIESKCSIYFGKYVSAESSTED